MRPDNQLEFVMRTKIVGGKQECTNEGHVHPFCSGGPFRGGRSTPAAAGKKKAEST